VVGEDITELVAVVVGAIPGLVAVAVENFTDVVGGGSGGHYRCGSGAGVGT
jgi:hypothetical protein